MDRPTDTRERILHLAEAAMLERGFGGVRVDALAAAAGVSRSGFLYHFATRGDLARGMIERFTAEGDVLFHRAADRARDLTGDPLQTVLVLLRMLAGRFENLPERGHPGCLIAAACYHDHEFDARVRALNRRAMEGRRDRVRRLLDEVAAAYPQVEPVDLGGLADHLTALIDGAIVISKATGEPDAIARQIRLYRSHIRLLFDPAIR